MKRVNPEWLMTEAEGTAWHEYKSTLGPIYPGYDSFIPYMNWVREKLEGYGCVDYLDYHWNMETYRVNDWPNHESGALGLEIDGKELPVGTFCMLSAPTPEDGVEAPMMFWDRAKDGMPTKGCAEGKILVIETLPMPEKPFKPAFLGSYVITDTNYRSNPQPEFPMYEIPDPSVNLSWQCRWNFFDWWDMFPALPDTGAKAIIICSTLTYGALKGLYDRQKVRIPSTIVVDRVTAKEVKEAAAAGKTAKVVLKSKFFWTDAYNYFMFQPGKYYGTDKDEYITVNIHVDAMSLTQDNGSIGAIGIARYFSHVPQEEREKTIVYCIDSRHFIEGFEDGNFQHDPYVVHPEVTKKVSVTVGLEHMGEMAAREDYENNTMVPTGVPEFTFMKADDNDWCARILINAAIHSGLERADIKVDNRPGIHGGYKGWVRAIQASTHKLGKCVIGQAGNWPGCHTQTFSTMQFFGPKKFRDEIATWTEVVLNLMSVDEIVYNICWHDLNTAIRKAETDKHLTSIQKEGLLSEVASVFANVEDGEYEVALYRLKNSTTEAVNYCLKNTAGDVMMKLNKCIAELEKWV